MGSAEKLMSEPASQFDTVASGDGCGDASNGSNLHILDPKAKWPWGDGAESDNTSTDNNNNSRASR